MRVSPNPWSKFIQFVFKIFKFFVMTMLIFFLSIYSRPFWWRNKAKKLVFFSMSLGWIDVQYVKSFAQGCSWGNTAFSLITLIYCLYDSQQPNKTYSLTKILLLFKNLSYIIPFKVYIIGFITSYTLTYSKLL